MAGKLPKIDNVFCSKINSYSQPSQAGLSFAGDGATATTGRGNSKPPQNAVLGEQLHAGRSHKLDFHL